MPNDLVQALRSMNRADNLHVMQVLPSELAKEEGVMHQAGADYPVWSPMDATDAADTPLKVLTHHAEG